MNRTVAEMPSRRLGLGMGAVTALALAGIILGALALVTQRDGAEPSAVAGDVTYHPSFAGVREHAAPSLISVKGIEAWGQRYQAQSVGNTVLLPTTHFGERGAELPAIFEETTEVQQRGQGTASIFEETTEVQQRGQGTASIFEETTEVQQRGQGTASLNDDWSSTTYIREAVR